MRSPAILPALAAGEQLAVGGLREGDEVDAVAQQLARRGRRATSAPVLQAPLRVGAQQRQLQRPAQGQGEEVLGELSVSSKNIDRCGYKDE